MDLAPWMDLVIGDYNHLFDPRSRLGFLGEESKCFPLTTLREEDDSVASPEYYKILSKHEKHPY